MKSLAALNTGSRYSIQRTTGLVNSVRPLPLALISPAPPCGLADADRGLVDERVLRHLQVARRRPAADAPGLVVMRAVARAEPAAVVAGRIARVLPGRHAAQVRANADHDQPLGLDHALLVRLRVGQLAEIDRPRLLDLLGRTVSDDH